MTRHLAMLVLACAWVLWTNAEYLQRETGWGIIQASPTRAECIVAMHKVAIAALPGGTLHEDINEGRFIAFTGIGNPDTGFVAGKCLPDTIDPRGPKR